MINSDEKKYLLRMDKNLFKQLSRYAKSNDLSIAQTARKALKQFIQEQLETNKK